jgi:CRISPR-associated protein Cas1
MGATQKNEGHVTPDTKRAVVLALYDDLQSEAGATPAITSLQRLATSLAQCYLGERERLDLPLPGLPIAMSTAIR